MVDRFMLGIDPDYNRYLERNVTQIMKSSAEELINKYAVGDEDQKKKILKEINPVITEKLKEHFATARDYRQENFSKPIINMAELLPKEELAHLAESLVNLTSFKRRMSLDTESVGGPIDVAVISKGDGFVWVKRKHYFDINLNRSFMDNYFRRHLTVKGTLASERRQKV